MKSGAIQRMVASALLIAIGIVIPMFSPVKLLIEPASFTLASHVAIFIAMMLTPGVAVAVAAGTTIGFFLGGFPIVVVMRAATHVIFALLGSLYLQKHPATLESAGKIRVFSLLVGIVHALCEVAVVCPFYFSGNMIGSYYDKSFVYTVGLLVGIGSMIHSMVDFEISLIIAKTLFRQRSFRSLRVPAR